ncbi:MAG: helix-turn-helix domain-containing protein [Candidatus Moraniibacteriota bacterium]
MVNDGFIRKKVESLTLGEKLKKLRQQYRMSYTEIAKATRIQAKYLEYLENGTYEKLPAEVYVRGFLKSYARYLGLEDEAFLKLYDKERHIRMNLGHESSPQVSTRYPAMNAWIITPRTVLAVLLVLVLGGTSIYLFSEFRSFVAEPRLLITDPLPGVTVEGSVIMLRGQTDPGATVTANGEPVFVGDTGEFREEITLQSGINRILIRATNRFEKTREEVVVVESRLPETAASSAVPETVPPGFTFVVRALTKTVNITVASGDTVLYSGTLLPGKEQRFTNLVESVRLSTDDALHTETSVDDGPSAPVGKESNSVSGKIYARESPPLGSKSTNP